MRKFIHTIVLKITNFKLSDYVVIEMGSSPDETTWRWSTSPLSWGFNLTHTLELLQKAQI